MVKEQRNSNFELLRIVSMVLIILYHIIYHGHVIELCATEELKNLFKIIEILTLVHVNSFVLLSGYYQWNKRFKQSKVWKIINASWFYRVIIVFIFMTLGLISIDKLTLFKDIFPLEFANNWFIKYYILLYLISPLLNAAIKTMSQKTHKRILLILFIMFCFMPWITRSQTFDNNGYTLYQFIYLYLIGGYLNKYNSFENSTIGQKSNLIKRSVLITIISVCVLSNFLLYHFSFKYTGPNAFLNDLILNIQISHLSYNNPFVLIQSIAYFLLFSTFKFKNRFINGVAALTIGVYLIHDNNYIRSYIYTWLNVNNTLVTSFTSLLWFILLALIIFIMCAIIEFIRQKLFLFIYNRKLSIKLRNSYYHLLDRLNI